MKIDLSNLTTEKRNFNTLELDIVSTEEMIKMINDEDKKIAYAVEKQIINIAKAVDIIANKLERGGRLIYLGAGTSGRLGILDASECPPTFGTPKELVHGIIAGGSKAVFSAVEGAEDDILKAVEDLKKIGFNDTDALVGITASGRTPYVLGGIEYAKAIGASSVAVTNNADSEIQRLADICIAVVVGSEALTGSTRMKAGTAQKMVLNMLSTGAMIKLGKVYENLMVDLESTNLKLKERCRNIIVEATSVDETVAAQFLEKTGYDVKLAIFMIMSELDKEVAQKNLKSHKGHIRKALKAIKKIQ
jgi:N-acetylmuramic acid 6-phosphate etherase